MNRKQHWERVYSHKSDREVGWFQTTPKTSLALVNKYTKEKNVAIIDIGAGNSFLSAYLLEKGFTNLTLTDISAKALERSKARLGATTNGLKFIESDILEFSSDQKFKLWHDRAVFHFILDRDEIGKYAKVAAKYIIHGGFLILGTFSLTGPKTCSGLPVTQYSEEMFCEVFDKYFELVECFDNVHITPSGNSQNFIWVVFKRK